MDQYSFERSVIIATLDLIELAVGEDLFKEYILEQQKTGFFIRCSSYL